MPNSYQPKSIHAEIASLKAELADVQREVKELEEARGAAKKPARPSAASGEQDEKAIAAQQLRADRLAHAAEENERLKEKYETLRTQYFDLKRQQKPLDEQRSQQILMKILETDAAEFLPPPSPPEETSES